LERAAVAGVVSTGRRSQDENIGLFASFIRRMIMKAETLLQEKREAIKRLVAKHGALNPRIFGSVARGEAGHESDIDLLVKMEEGRSLLDLSALVLDLQELLGVKVDVVSEDGLYWLLRRRILKEASPL
jgi:predicted nucleotidyltransferase